MPCFTTMELAIFFGYYSIPANLIPFRGLFPLFRPTAFKFPSPKNNKSNFHFYLQSKAPASSLGASQFLIKEIPRFSMLLNASCDYKQERVPE